jgi:hypothetical protein
MAGVIAGARPAAAEPGKKPPPEFFCAGADIKMLEGAHPYLKVRGAVTMIVNALVRLRSVEPPTTTRSLRSQS